MLKILHARCLGLSPAISAQFTLEMRAAAENRKKITETFFWATRSLNGIDVGTTFLPRYLTFFQLFFKNV